MNDVLAFPTDRGLRRRWFVESSFSHPAKLHLGLLQWLIDRYTVPNQTVADPMAGSGSLLLAALQQRNVILREVEPRFLALCHANAARILDAAGWLAGEISIASGDAREPWGYQADVIITSPPYGVEVRSPRGDAVLARRAEALMRQSKRWQQLARAPKTHGSWMMQAFRYGDHPAQIGHLRGARYWTAMEAIYRQAHAALVPVGVLVLVIKDHVRKHQHVPVADQTAALCQAIGFSLQERHQRRVWPLGLWQRRRKERGELVIEFEDVLVMQKQENPR